MKCHLCQTLGIEELKLLQQVDAMQSSWGNQLCVTIVGILDFRLSVPASPGVDVIRDISDR
jgi:hypothetical protein